MFEIFDDQKREIIRGYFDGATPFPDDGLHGALNALSECRGQVVGALGREEDPEFRQQLRVLYEGVTIIMEFIAGGGGSSRRSKRIASVGDESAPAVRD